MLRVTEPRLGVLASRSERPSPFSRVSPQRTAQAGPLVQSLSQPACLCTVRDQWHGRLSYLVLFLSHIYAFIDTQNWKRTTGSGSSPCNHTLSIFPFPKKGASREQLGFCPEDSDWKHDLELPPLMLSFSTSWPEFIPTSLIATCSCASTILSLTHFITLSTVWFPKYSLRDHNPLNLLSWFHLSQNCPFPLPILYSGYLYQSLNALGKEGRDGMGLTNKRR